MKTLPTRTYGHSKGSPKRKVYSHAYIRRTERSQINKLMLHLNFLEKQEQAKPKTSRRREIIKTRAKINEIETKKKTIQVINKTKSGSLKK
jgi:hypothetical protein